MIKGKDPEDQEYVESTEEPLADSDTLDAEPDVELPGIEPIKSWSRPKPGGDS